MVNLFEGCRPINRVNEAKKWEKCRARGFFRSRMLLSLFFAFLGCFWGSVWFFLREIVFGYALPDDWVIDFAIQNIVYFLCGFCSGYFITRALWNNREEQYQIYLKNNKLEIPE